MHRVLAAAAGRLSLVTAVLCGVLAGCAVPVPSRQADAAGAIVVDSIELDAVPRAAHWYLPAAEPAAIVVFEHGFSRSCAHLRESTRRLMAAGLMALCVDVPMARGNPALAEALAGHLARDGVAPDGRAVPRHIVVAGHSAGATFALALGARLEGVAPGRLVGALLVDPVDAGGADATRGFEALLRAVSATGRRPVLALLAPPHRCNADGNALAPLRRVERQAREEGGAGPGAFAIVPLAEGATHADIEGEDTDALARWACGTPDPARVEALRMMVVDWVRRVTAAGGGPGAPGAPPH